MSLYDPLFVIKELFRANVNLEEENLAKLAGLTWITLKSAPKPPKEPAMASNLAEPKISVVLLRKTSVSFCAKTVEQNKTDATNFNIFFIFIFKYSTYLLPELLPDELGEETLPPRGLELLGETVVPLLGETVEFLLGETVEFLLGEL